ncbi:MAG TPA: universal stress protein [Candidatus Binataceae bacterium]|nr:universal stress protein [Candidatus Binataceae bacterium]
MAYPFKQILSPVQFDENSLTALSVARDLALTHDATVHVLYVVPIILVPGEGYIVYSLEEQEQNAKKTLTEMVQKHLAGVKYEVVTRIGEVARSVLDVAQTIGADVIVMATHGRSGLPHFFLGSVAETVVREAHCPVLTIRPGGKEASGTGER